MYLFHARTESFKIEKFGVVGETRAHIIHALVFLFDELKCIYNILLISHYARVT